ncbi:hypothetical protein FDECE_11294 [Fusarium decemcellulare]|nr:hypothetical protein FDECE_11294 [Fusarium decemcellulare]
MVYRSLLEVKGAFIPDSTAMSNSGAFVSAIRGVEFKRLRLSAFQQVVPRNSTAVQPQKSFRHQDKPQVSNDLVTPATSDEAINTPINSRGSPLHDVATTLKKIIMEAGDFSNQVDYTKSLDGLGIDSLMQIEIMSKLAHVFPSQPELNHQAFRNARYSSL